VHSRWIAQHSTYTAWWIVYLAGKDDDRLDGPGSLVLQELLNNEGAEGTCTDDGEVCVSRHELTMFAVRKPIL
jgi:hypothetical protein